MSRLKSLAIESRWYWYLRTLTRSLKFQIRRRHLTALESFQDRKTDTQLFTLLLQMSLGPALVAGAVAFCLLLSELYIFGNDRFSSVFLWGIPNRDSYTGFLGTVAAIGGVLIGLYYAGLTAVSSAAYANVPNNIRSLLVREKRGSLYMRFLAFVTFLSLCLIYMREIGFSPPRLAPAVVIGLAAISIFSFVRLGQQAFYFFDPTILSHSIFSELYKWMRRATVDAPHWDDEAFQSYAQRQAQSAFDSLVTLLEISLKAEHLKGGPTIELSIWTAQLLAAYTSVRRKIPTTSLWYPQDYKHIDWYASPESAAHLAETTGDILHPGQKADSSWFEDRCLRVITVTLANCIAAGKHELVLQLVSALQGYVERLGENGRIEEALSVADRLARLIIASPPDQNDPKVQRAISAYWEYVSIIPIQVFLAFARTAETDAAKHFSTVLAGCRWSQTKSLYQQAPPLYLATQLEWLFPRLRFEQITEGRIITPYWYQMQVLALAESQQLSMNLALLSTANETHYEKWRIQQTGWIGAMILNRQREFLAKLRAHSNKLSAKWDELQKLKILKDMLAWPSFNVQNWVKGLQDHERKTDIAVAASTESLADQARPEYMPDFAGAFLNITGTTLLRGCIHHDLALVTQLLPAYFSASVKKSASLMPTASTDELTNDKITIAASPILDLIEISGWAYASAELHQDPQVWEVAKNLWDSYLAAAPPRLPVLVAFIRASDVPGLLQPRELKRTSWRTEFHQRLDQLERVATHRIGPPFAVTDEQVLHPSALIRVLAKESFGGFYRGIDLFAAFYLAAREDSEPYRQFLSGRDVGERVSREESHDE